MRVALISDLHGNELALDAVLADVARVGVDEIFCLGDVATLGPRPGAVLARLRDLGSTGRLARQHRGMLLVNPGSVGMPFKEYVGGGVPTLLAHAEYAIIEAVAGGLRADLRRVALDRRALRDAALACVGNPLAPHLAQQYS